MSPSRSIDRRTLLRVLPLVPISAGLSGSLVRALQPSSRGRQPVPFLEQTRVEPGTRFGSELAGRLAFDLRRIVDEGLVVGNDDFYIRTRAPEGVASRGAGDWSVQFIPPEDFSGHLRDFGGPQGEISIEELREDSRDQGLHLLECSGNSARHRFGLLSVARWSGVPVSDLLDRTFSNVSPDQLVLATGNDDHAEPSRSSQTGASWVFTVEQIRDTGAFLATSMNGEPLPLDHGAPVRLVVPGWYGCTCLKWVESFEGVSADHPSTSQMREFATRTHQSGVPERARDFLPAEIDFTAMPILVEGPDEHGSYRLTGIAWGDARGVEGLQLSYRPPSAESQQADWQSVGDFLRPERSSWSLWTHRFEPKGPGELEFRLRAAQSSVRTRRLDTGFYTRRVRI